jgi:ElaB/YqjD/DUF883 family membrane-anchored ribosome-binding protein
VSRLIFQHACVVALVALTAPAAVAQTAAQYPRLQSTVALLREAREALAGIRDDYSGRREAAVRAIDEAVVSLRIILRVRGDDAHGNERLPDYARRNVGSKGYKPALTNLRSAREELRSARGEFSDLRERAEKSLDYAISRVSTLAGEVTPDSGLDRDGKPPRFPIR